MNKQWLLSGALLAVMAAPTLGAEDKPDANPKAPANGEASDIKKITWKDSLTDALAEAKARDKWVMLIVGNSG